MNLYRFKRYALILFCIFTNSVIAENINCIGFMLPPLWTSVDMAASGSNILITTNTGGRRKQKLFTGYSTDSGRPEWDRKVILKDPQSGKSVVYFSNSASDQTDSRGIYEIVNFVDLKQKKVVGLFRCYL